MALGEDGEKLKIIEAFRPDEEWSFDRRRFILHLQDDFTAVIRGHLYVEHIMIAFLTSALPHSGQLDLERLTYPTKASLCAALGLLPPDLLGAVSKLNTFRNHTAHDLDFAVTDREKEEFQSSFSGRLGQEMRKKIEAGEEPPPSKTSLAYYIAVVVFSLEVLRQQYLKQRKEHDSLMKEAEKAARDLGLGHIWDGVQAKEGEQRS